MPEWRPSPEVSLPGALMVPLDDLRVVGIVERARDMGLRDYVDWMASPTSNRHLMETREDPHVWCDHRRCVCLLGMSVHNYEVADA